MRNDLKLQDNKMLPFRHLYVSFNTLKTIKDVKKKRKKNLQRDPFQFTRDFGFHPMLETVVKYRIALRVFVTR